MAPLKIVPLTALLLGLIVLISCNDSDEDEKRPNNPSGNSTIRKPKAGDSDEENEREKARSLLPR